MGLIIRSIHYYGLFLVLLGINIMAGSGSGSGSGSGHALNLNGLLGLDICRDADHPPLCRSVVKGLTNPTLAIESAINQLMTATNLAMGSAKRRQKSQEMEVCMENYDDAYTNLQTCLTNLKAHDENSLNINLSAALTDYVTCDDAIAEGGSGGLTSSPVVRNNAMLRQMAANCLYLSSLIFVH